MVDNSIASLEYHTHQPLTTRFENNDEIRIPVQDDLCTLPCESYLLIEGSLKKEDDTIPKTKFSNNGLAYLFSNIRLELNGVTLDSITNPGLTTTMKAYLSFSPNESVRYQNAGWFNLAQSKLVDAKGNFSACIPLKMLLGFAEDYRRVVVNIRQELVLVRSNSDTNALEGDKCNVSITKIYWRVPHVTPGLNEELALTKYIGKNVDTQIAFRSWQLHVYPTVSQTKMHTWAVATMTKTSSPRYVILGFQTAREDRLEKTMAQFDHCNFRNIRVFLNNQRFPYSELNLDIANGRYSDLYEMFASFQKSYYGKECEPLLNVQEFLKNTLIVVDTSKQREHLQPSSVTLRIEYETSENVPAETNAFCLVLSDKIFSYNALTKMVKQL